MSEPSFPPRCRRPPDRRGPQADRRRKTWVLKFEKLRLLFQGSNRAPFPPNKMAGGVDGGVSKLDRDDDADARGLANFVLGVPSAASISQRLSIQKTSQRPNVVRDH